MTTESIFFASLQSLLSGAVKLYADFPMYCGNLRNRIRSSCIKEEELLGLSTGPSRADSAAAVE